MAEPCGRWTGGEKKSAHAAERNTQRVISLRAAFVEAVHAEDFTYFKFVDEVSTNLTCRRYAHAEGGQQAYQATPLHGGQNVNAGGRADPERAAKRP